MSKEYRLITEDEFLSCLKDYAEFSNIELRDIEMAGLTAYNLVFHECKFVRCSMTDNRWENLSAYASTFYACTFIGSNFEDAVFERCNFFDAETSQGCNFSHARLRSVLFKSCTISYCLFEGSDIFLAAIEDSEAVGAKFFKAQFDGSVRLVNNVFKYADLRGADLSKCDLSQNDFTWAVLDEVNFEKSILIGSNLSGVSLRSAKFAQADLRGAVLGQLDIRTADFEGIKIFESQMRGLLENCRLIIFPDNR